MEFFNKHRNLSLFLLALVVGTAMYFIKKPDVSSSTNQYIAYLTKASNEQEMNAFFLKTKHLRIARVNTLYNILLEIHCVESEQATCARIEFWEYKNQYSYSLQFDKATADLFDPKTYNKKINNIWSQAFLTDLTTGHKVEIKDVGYNQDADIVIKVVSPPNQTDNMHWPLKTCFSEINVENGKVISAVLQVSVFRITDIVGDGCDDIFISKLLNSSALIYVKNFKTIAEIEMHGMFISFFYKYIDELGEKPRTKQDLAVAVEKYVNFIYEGLN